MPLTPPRDGECDWERGGIREWARGDNESERTTDAAGAVTNATGPERADTEFAVRGELFWSSRAGSGMDGTGEEDWRRALPPFFFFEDFGRLCFLPLLLDEDLLGFAAEEVSLLAEEVEDGLCFSAGET